MYLTHQGPSLSHTSVKISVELAGIGPRACAPYPSDGGMQSFRVSPTIMPGWANPRESVIHRIASPINAYTTDTLGRARHASRAWGLLTTRITLRSATLTRAAAAARVSVVFGARGPWCVGSGGGGVERPQTRAGEEAVRGAAWRPEARVCVVVVVCVCVCVWGGDCFRKHQNQYQVIKRPKLPTSKPTMSWRGLASKT